MAIQQDDKSLFFGGRWSGISQLTFIEHALSPLGEHGPFNRVANYFYSLNGKRTLGTANISAAVGYEPEDDFYLWGLLALTLSQEVREPKLYCSARYILRQLNLGEGGKNIATLRKALTRLGSVRYENDSFYDPIRKTHRHVQFGLLSFNLPTRDDSIQGWHIYWDQAFFEMVEPLGGFHAFDLDNFRKLKPAAGRLFLWLSKYFYSSSRRKEPVKLTAFQDVQHLSVHVLGYADDLQPKTYNQKLKACIRALEGMRVISDGTTIEKTGKGKFRVRFTRGAYFDEAPTEKPVKKKDQAVFDTLKRIGLEPNCIRWVVRDFKIGLVNQWADVTFAAIEEGRIKTTAQQFFMHHLKKAKAGEVTPPDWFRERERDKIRSQSVEVRKQLEDLGIRPCPGPAISDDEGFEQFLQTEGRGDYRMLVRNIFTDLRRGQVDTDEARVEAEKRARKELQAKFRRRNPNGPRRAF